MTYGIPHITLQQIQRSLAAFGFEEKILTGDLDIVDTWEETTVNSGTVTQNNEGKITIGSGVVLNSTASERLRRNIGLFSGFIGSGKQFKKVILEWNCKFVNVANIDNTTFFMGWVRAIGIEQNRSNNFIQGFSLNTDLIHALSDVNGVESEIDISSGITLTDFNLFKIEFDGVNWYYYINNILKHTEATNVIYGASHLMFFLGNDAALETYIMISNIRFWWE